MQFVQYHIYFFNPVYKLNLKFLAGTKVLARNINFSNISVSLLSIALTDHCYRVQFVFNMAASMSSKLNFEQFPVSDCYKIIYPPSGKSANFNSQRWNFSSKPYKRRLPVNRSGFMEIDFGPRLDLILMHRSN